MLSRHYACRVSDRLRLANQRLLVMENELLRVTLLLDKGADIVELRYKPRDLDFLWHSPNPLFWGSWERESAPAPAGPFPDYYEGCWQEILPNAGRACEWGGAPLGQHGEVWALPWDCKILEDDPGMVWVELTVRCRRMPLSLTRRMILRAGVPALFLDEELHNDSPVDLAVMWGHHPAYGEPFLGPACRIDAPDCQVLVDPHVGPRSRFDPSRRFTWPESVTTDGARVDISRIAAREEGVDEMYYLTDLSAPWYALVNEDMGLTCALAWGGSAFKCVWYWASLGGDLSWPSWGRYYTVALEPMSSWPAILTNAIEKGTELRLEAGETVEERLTVVVSEKASPVRDVSIGAEVTQ